MTKRKNRWIMVAITGVLLVLAVVSCIWLRSDFQAKTGLWYRKRMLAYVSPMVLALLLSCFRPQIPPKWHALSRVLFVVLAVVLAADVFQRMAWEAPEVYLEPDDTRLGMAFVQPRFIVVNIAITAVIFTVVWLLVWDSRLAAMVTFWLMWLLGYAYSCVLQMRGTIFQLADLSIMNTAFAVLGSYRFPVSARYVFWAMFGYNLALLSRWIPKRTGKRRVCAGKAVCVALSCVCVFVLLGTPFLHSIGAVTTTWFPNAVFTNAQQGALTTLAKEAWEMRQNRPENYDAKRAAQIDQRLNQAGFVTEMRERPNVIVIMNESLTDFSSLYDIPSDRDALPFIHSLRDKTVYGNLYSSSYGGQTCNIEHSFLTGAIPIPNRLSYLLRSTNETTPSLAWQLKALGYQTFAIHPERGKNYQRNMYYPLLGLDKFLDKEWFWNIEWVHGWPSDRECFDRIMTLHKEKAPDERIFVFNVTMQNHGGYGGGFVEETVKVVGRDDVEMTDYLSSISFTDRAFEELIGYFEQQQEPTVVLMFGDHQPELDLSAYEKKADLSEMARQFTQQITPFVIWANYPIETEYVEGLSVNYLAALLLEKAGLPMTGYDQWLLEKAEEYPVVILQGYADAEGNSSLWDDDPANWPVTLRQLNDLRYNRLYDEKNRLPALRRMTAE